MEQARRILKEVFGFDDFRPLQAEIIQSILDGRDLLAIMPTGGGKSLCYQIPALLKDGLTIVVSPLISLMKDQVDQLRQVGAPVAILNSSLTADVYRANVERIRRGEARLLYAAPESLMKPNLLEFLKTVRIDCFAIDEAHCISFWGHDFRPEYRRLNEVRGFFPGAVCAAFTATATPRVREDIKECLGFSDAREFVASFDRENLFLEVRPKENPWGQVLDFIGKFPDESGIVYCFTRKQVDALHGWLEEEGFSALPYHAGLTDAERSGNQERFIRDDVRIVVATIAFGMGIDKPNIRFVIHFDLPKTLEHYYQEIGRAGRDGLPAWCLLLFGYGDVRKVRYFIDKGQNPEEKRIALSHLQALLDYAQTEDCRRRPLLSYFGQRYALENCGMCDNCNADGKDLEDVTVPAQKFLSCVLRTGERFGANHVIDVLRGSKAQKVLKFGHDALSTYNIGTDISKDQWLRLSRRFIDKGFMVQDMQFGSIKVTERGWAVLRGKEKVWGYLEKAAPAPEAGDDAGEKGNFDNDLFQRLRKLRKSLADEAEVPPYVVFSDKTLVEMAAFFPKSPESLEKIHGVGKVKLENYGPVFLDEIKAHCRERGIEEIPISRAASVKKTAPSSAKKRYAEVGEAFAAGKSVEWLANYYKVKESTVLSNLYDYLKDGHRLGPEGFRNLAAVPEEQEREAIGVFDEFGAYRLKPVFEALGGRVSYEDLHRLRLYYLCLRAPEALSDVLDPKMAAASAGRIVCLANSRKYSGCCIAGKELIGNRIGKWVRPASESETGELAVKCTVLEGGRTPRPLDILEIPLKRPDPKDYQTENYSISEEAWKRTGGFPLSGLERLIDRPDSLWINGHESWAGKNDRVPVDTAKEQIDKSLYLIRPENLTVVVCEDARLLKKVRVEFDYKGETYCLYSTDPELEGYFLEQPLGDYPAQNDDVYVTVSLGEPFHGFCYKLAAAVINLEI